MKKLWPLILTVVMVAASCDQYSEGEHCPISLDTVYADPNSIVMTVFVNESYLQLNYCELGAVCSTSKTPPSGDVGISAIKTSLARKGLYQLEFSGSFPEARYYVHLYTSSHESGKARYHDCIEVVMDDVPNVPDGDSFINLSANGTANCYIVNRGGKYKFRPVKGNSDETLDVKSVEVLWESFGTDETPEVGALIPYAEYRDFDADGYFDVYFNATDRKGNAVIAAKDASGSILWSWHIWLTDQPVECVYANNAGTMMDRNLGATSATPGDVGALGLLYQWGRKDPFLGSSSISDVVDAQSTISWPSAIESDGLNGTILYATQCPTQFIMYNTINYDWYYTGDLYTDDTRWQSSKTIYDPCPAGWRVPDGGDSGFWAKAGFVAQSYDSSSQGMLFGSGISFPSSWYPAAGYRNSFGSLLSVSKNGRYWSVTPSDQRVYGFYLNSTGTVNPASNNYRVGGLSVRCMKDDLGEGPSEPEESVSWILHGSNGDITMTKDGDRYVAREVVFPDPTVASNGRPYNKFQIHNSLGTSYGSARESMTVITPGEVLQLTEGYNSIYIEQGVYDIWFHPGNLTVEVALLDYKYTVFEESANCYIVPSGGIYNFRAVRGNSNQLIEDVSKVEVLWESFGTDVAPKVGDLIKSVSYMDGEITFQTADTFKEGNAVIAAKDVSGTILWSWHIWLTDQPVECVYASDAGTMMDRNLGATSAVPGDVEALGLLYQWGRKDPFLGSSSINDNVEAESTISWPSAIESDALNGTILYATQCPTQFIMYNTINYDWYYTGDTTTDDTRWQSEKTIYDPCPAGWRVPDGGSNGVWALAGFEDQQYDTSSQGMLFGSGVSSPATWYPEVGRRSCSTGKLINVGNSGYFWSCSPQGYKAHHLILSYGNVSPNIYNNRAFGESVRCLKEGTGGGTPEPEVPATNLSESGTANAYIVSKKGAYKFSSVKGNSVTSVGTVASAEVLWESFGTDVAPNVGDLIKSVSYKNGKITFQTADTFKEGNAVIAAKDVSGTILWSWHIWLTDQPQECVYANNAGTMMDRNLGATSATPGDVGALGLLYQWGRKDPFLGSSSINDNVEAESTISWPSAIESDALNGSILYATQCPTQFIMYNTINYDWYYTGDTTTDDTRWQSEKTIYDPCPAGWRVPDGGSDGVWALAGFNGYSYDTSTQGMLLDSGVSSPATWYPEAGRRTYSSGILNGVDIGGFFWSGSPQSNKAHHLFLYKGNVSPNSYNYRAFGESVRCMKEGTGGGTPEPEVPATNLSESGTANAYIVSKKGAYKFSSVKGNSVTSVGTVASAEVLWESFGTDVAPNVGDLIKSVSYIDGEIAFQTADSFKEGNAVIAAKDASGTILWSWHIWLTDQPQECVYANNAGTMMDRNLGATSATPGDVGALGLFYQWGRKDPFLGSSSINDNVEAESTISWPSAIESDALNGTILYATQCPTQFIKYNAINYDWYYTGDTTTDDTRWQSEKTIYDPCPAGWRVPDGGSNGVWALAGFKGYSSATSTQGMLLDSGVSSPATWYPEAGRRTSNGVIAVVGTSGYFWSSSTQGNIAHHLILSNGNVSTNSYYNRAFGESVRCLKEGTGGGTSEPEVPATNLSESGTANAYIVSKKGAYKFSSVKGNSVTSVGTVASAEVLWESFGTDVAPNVGDLIKSVSYKNGKITFQTADTFKEGNAVIAAKDVSGTILWSWHIWLTDKPVECVYANNAGTMMDRNLGATSATPGDVGTLGLLYQWGRKDPFLGSSSISDNVDAQSTISWPSEIASDASNGTISYATEHPTTFITYNGSNRDWYYTGNSNTDDTRWQSEKTIYDPCPAGWRVPDGGSDGVWAKAGFYDLPYDGLNNNGVLFGEDISVPSTWYPAAGYRALYGRGVDYVGTTGYYWSVTITSNYAYNFNNIGGYRTPKDSKFSRGDAQSVRCMKE